MSTPPQVVPLYIKAASVFSGRIIKEDDSFQNMVAEMTSHFADKKAGATDVLVGGLYAVQEDEDFHRSDGAALQGISCWTCCLQGPD